MHLQQRGKHRWERGAEKSCALIRQTKGRVAEIRWRSGRGREKPGETAKGCIQVWSEAAAHQKLRESHHQDLKGEKG